MEVECKLLITSVLEPVWCNVAIRLNKTEMLVAMKDAKQSSNNPKSNTDLRIGERRSRDFNFIKAKQDQNPRHHSSINFAYVTKIMINNDEKTVRVDTRSNFFGTLGYYLFHFPTQFEAVCSFLATVKIDHAEKLSP